MSSASTGAINEQLYSRQLGVFGHEAMGKLIQMDVLIVGLRGLGVEIAKNLILAGPRSVTLFDPEPTTMYDVTSNYYLSEADVGSPRAAACIKSLAELNNLVKVSLLPGSEVTESVLTRFHCVVVTNTPRAIAAKWNDICHNQPNPIPFLCADVFGVSGYAFADFGANHIINDPDGEPLRSAIITSITPGNPGEVTVHCDDKARHQFEDTHHVTFREVEGADFLNASAPRKVLATAPYSFTVELFPGEELPAPVYGGIVEQKHVSFTVSSDPLSHSENYPTQKEDGYMLLTPDLSKFGRSEQLHLASAAVHKYWGKHGKLPTPWDDAAITEIIAYAKEMNDSNKDKEGAIHVDELDEKVVKNVAGLASVELPALCAFFGGVVAQEVVKTTGKFTPLRQWLHLEFFELINIGGEPATREEGSNTRYDTYVHIFGKEFQQKVMNQKVFVVGAGALGCEFLKSFALMGVGAGPDGLVTVTDMDRIELSNLNRQFLFRNWNVGTSKSITAAAAAQAMNPGMKIEALETAVGPDTETVFNDALWDRTDVVFNALDNLEARQYVDNKCVFHSKPLLESGTLGTKANTQVIFPFLTESYNDSQDPPEDGIPMCTLRNFPHAIEHCIEWARDVFEGSFTNTIKDAETFKSNPAQWISELENESNLAARRAKLEGVMETLKAASNSTFDQCVSKARLMFNNRFTVEISQLLHNFGPDYVDPSTGVKFWSGTKRCPSPLAFNLDDPLHLSFIKHTAALFAYSYGIPLPANWDDKEYLGKIISQVSVPPFVPQSVRIKVSDEDNTVEGSDDDSLVCAGLTKELEEFANNLGETGLAQLSLNPSDFEKDDDSNHHIAFITAVANLRASNYKIKQATFYETKMTAGKIIPAIATTTCAITGLVCVEFYKVVAGNLPIESLRNTFMNLALNIYAMGEPGPSKKTQSKDFDPIAMGPIKAIPEGFSRWDKIVVKEGNLTFAQFTDWLKSKYNVDVHMITSGKTILYNPLMFRAHIQSRGGRPIKDVYEELTKATIPSDRNYILLDLSASDDEADVLMPPVQLYFR